MCKLVTLGLIFVTTLMPTTTSLKEPVLCPLQCVCHLRRERHVIDCSHKNLTSLPFLCNFENDKSGKKVEFYANGNKFRYILKSAFYHVRSRLSHLEITSNTFNIELAYSTFNSFVDSLEILKLEPVYENLNTLINSLENLNNLKVLHLTSVTNSFQILSYKFAHPNLTDLSLPKCRIRNISSGVFQNLNQLRVLNLSFNHLADFPQELVDVVSRSVSVLKISNNEISQINDGDIAKGCKLAFLDLSFNAINFIEEGVLEKCGRLRFLNLSHNPNLVSLGRFVFDGLVGLNLDISHTPISSLDFVKPGAVARVLAFGTELECSCDVQVKHMEALHGNLKGTCRLKVNAVNIQSKVLNCAQNEQRQKRVRFNDWNSGGENGLDLDINIDTVPNHADSDPSQADTDPNQADDESRLNVQTELKPSTWDPYLGNSQEATQRGCKIKPCLTFDSFTNKDEGIVDHMSVADSSKAEETREETIEISEKTLIRPGPSTSLGSIFDISSTSVNSESITPSPIMSNPIGPEPSISFQVPATESFEMTASLNFPNDDFLASTAKIETDAKARKISNSPQQKPSIIDAFMDVVDGSIGMPFKTVLLSTSMLDVSSVAPEYSSSFTTDIPSAQSEISSATPEMPRGASEHQSFKAYVNIEELSMQRSHSNIYSCTDVSCLETTQTTMPPKQTPAPCGDHDHTIQPSTTITIVNSIYSTITYIRDYTYYIKTVNHLNPQFLPPTKTRDYVITESPKDTQNTRSDAPSAPNAEVEKDTVIYVKTVPNESDQQSELETEGVMKDGDGDEHTDKDGGYFFQGPVYLLACFVHAWLLFAAFLKLEPGVKIKR